ncbi:MAG: hypothetical protein JWL73_3638 [Actinomycetia bacterium]|nr:hypothetical protein [Actinomycetes bacterium]
MRRTLPLIACALLLLTFLGACSSKSDAVAGAQKSGKLAPKPFCQAAYNLDEAVATVKDAKRLALLTVVVDRAPADIRPDAELFLTGFQRAHRGEKISAAQRKRYETASNNLERYANNKCALFLQNQPPGGNM